MTYENRIKEGKRLYELGNRDHPYAVEYFKTLHTQNEELSPQKRAKKTRRKYGR